MKASPFVGVSRDCCVGFSWSSFSSGFSVDFDSRFLRDISSPTIVLSRKEDVKSFELGIWFGQITRFHHIRGGNKRRYLLLLLFYFDHV